MKAIVAVLGLALLPAAPQRALAWGDDGHKTVALIAQHYLTPGAKGGTGARQWERGSPTPLRVTQS
jgi:hypothetical protein